MEGSGPIQDRIEALVDEEHRLWHAADQEHGLTEDEHARLEAVRAELDACWDSLRRRRAGSPRPTGPVPFPPNDLDEPPYEPEPEHLERGGARENNPAPDPDVNPNVP
jgi:Protein of unknown function (DUF2630)